MKLMSKIKYQMSKRGFTLIEMLVVISIIGILATIIIANMAGVRERARDARRKSDIRQIQNAIQMYYNDHKTLPSSCGGCNQFSYVPNNGCPMNSTDVGRWQNLAVLLAPYISNLPVDPLNSGNYRYSYGCFTFEGRDEYEIDTLLENTSDLDDNNDGGSDPAMYEKGTNLINNVYIWY